MADGYLLDTHVLIWWMIDHPDLAPTARALIADSANRILVSAASLWEIAVKQRTGRLQGADDYLADYRHWHRIWRFTDLPIGSEHGVVAGSLPAEHRDPVDRLLVAQSRCEGVPLITDNATIRSLHRDCVW